MQEKIKIVLFIILIITLWIAISIYWSSQDYSFDLAKKELDIKDKELKIKEETYISSLLDQYNRDIQGCTSAVRERNKEATEEDIKKSCIEPINKSRTAELLKSWGYSDLLAE